MATKSKITDARREVLYAELHALLTAGLDFSHAFALLTEGERDVRVKGLLERLYGAVVGGAALWQAMAQSGVFRALDCGVVRIGEQTGRLPETLDFLRDYYRKRAAQQRLAQREHYNANALLFQRRQFKVLAHAERDERERRVGNKVHAADYIRGY